MYRGSFDIGLLCLITRFSIKMNEINESYMCKSCPDRGEHTIGDIVFY